LKDSTVNPAFFIAPAMNLVIDESERLFHLPIGRRPDDHPGLSDLGL
jgi:uncharacterized protein